MAEPLMTVETSGNEPANMWSELLSQVLRDREKILQRIYSGDGLSTLVIQLLLINALVLGIYGGIMGMGAHGIPQVLSSAVKLPMLYLLSLGVCFPLLYIVNVVMGSKLGVVQTFGMILIAVTLNSLMLAACAPIALFFYTTDSAYDFLKLMHVGFLGFSGMWAMAALYRAIQHVCDESAVYPKQALKILMIWIVIFGFVGAQMAWTLRPYLGAPDLKFEFLRESGQGNFYQAIWQSLKNL